MFSYDIFETLRKYTGGLIIAPFKKGESDLSNICDGRPDL